MYIVTISSLLISIALVFYSVFQTKDIKKKNEELNELKSYNNTLVEMNDNVRCFKHDFSNIIQALGGYIQTDDMQGLKKYYSQLLTDCQTVNNLNILNPNIINNPAIYSLLTSKYQKASSEGINFNIYVFHDISKLKMDTYKFTRILGILLDNAIEATRECEEKKIDFTFRLDPKVSRQLLVVENTYKDKNIDTEKIYEKSYSTKPNNTGLGLWEVRKILKKYKNLNLFTEKNDKYFKQQLEIYL